jgi:ABC-type antimicrobial peptide transport system permease subunit
MDDVLSQSAAQRRFAATIVGLFAALTLVLAVVGLYGVRSYGVAHRTGEIGIRMALGAARSPVLQMVLIEGVRPAVLAAALGMIVAILTARFVRSLLFSVSRWTR